MINSKKIPLVFFAFLGLFHAIIKIEYRLWKLIYDYQMHSRNWTSFVRKVD